MPNKFEPIVVDAELPLPVLGVPKRLAEDVAFCELELGLFKFPKMLFGDAPELSAGFEFVLVLLPKSVGGFCASAPDCEAGGWLRLPKRLEEAGLVAFDAGVVA